MSAWTSAELDLDELNRRHGTDFRLAGRYCGGEVGATRLVASDGRRFVFKPQSPGLAVRTAEVLRPLGYPVPRYVAWGRDYHIQEELPGQAAGEWGAASARVGAAVRAE